MKELILDGNRFTIFENVLSDQERSACFHDVKSLVSQGYVSDNVPPLQTPPFLHDRVKHLSHWNKLYVYMKTCMQLNLELDRSWANLTVKNGTYGMHSHKSDFTFCYFVRSEHPE
jgi:hypothetical protein